MITNKDILQGLNELDEKQRDMIIENFEISNITKAYDSQERRIEYFNSLREGLLKMQTVYNALVELDKQLISELEPGTKPLKYNKEKIEEKINNLETGLKTAVLDMFNEQFLSEFFNADLPSTKEYLRRYRKDITARNAAWIGLTKIHDALVEEDVANGK